MLNCLLFKRWVIHCRAVVGFVRNCSDNDARNFIQICCMSNGCGAETCFVGEGAAAQTPNQSFFQQNAAAGTQNSLGAEGTDQNLTEGISNITNIAADNNYGKYNVKQAHDGNQQLGDLADPLDAAHQGNGADHGNGNSATISRFQLCVFCNKNQNP